VFCFGLVMEHPVEEYEIIRGEPDVYGQTHPVESSELIQSKLDEFEDELQKLPTDQLEALRMAQEQCPELLSNEFKLIFLRCDVFQPQVCGCVAHLYIRPSSSYEPDKKSYSCIICSFRLRDSPSIGRNDMKYWVPTMPSGR
jgi:hypothetical protein